MKSMDNLIKIVAFMSLTFLTSCEGLFSLGITNPRYSQYSREEIKKAAILSMAAKLEKRYHSHLKNTGFKEMDDSELGDKPKQSDFLRRLREND